MPGGRAAERRRREAGRRRRGAAPPASGVGVRGGGAREAGGASRSARGSVRQEPSACTGSRRLERKEAPARVMRGEGGEREKVVRAGRNMGCTFILWFALCGSPVHHQQHVVTVLVAISLILHVDSANIASNNVPPLTTYGDRAYCNDHDRRPHATAGCAPTKNHSSPPSCCTQTCMSCPFRVIAISPAAAAAVRRDGVHAAQHGGGEGTLGVATC